MWLSGRSIISLSSHGVSRSENRSVFQIYIIGPIYSFIQAISTAPLLLLRGAPDTALILCRNFTPKRHRQLRVKDTSYVAARAGFEPTTLRTKSDESTNEPPRP